jgi:transcriptional regulator with GAF, ATPase, and Fis domain
LDCKEDEKIFLSSLHKQGEFIPHIKVKAMNSKDMDLLEKKMDLYSMDLKDLNYVVEQDPVEIKNSPDKRDEQKKENLIFQILLTYYCMETQLNFKEFFDKLERMVIVKTLSIFNGNQKDSAKFLGMKYTTLNEKIKRHNISFRKSPY